MIPGGKVDVAPSVSVNAGFAISNLIGTIVSDVQTVLSVPSVELLVRATSGVGYADGRSKAESVGLHKQTGESQRTLALTGN